MGAGRIRPPNHRLGIEARIRTLMSKFPSPYLRGGEIGAVTRDPPRKGRGREIRKPGMTERIRCVSPVDGRLFAERIAASEAGVAASLAAGPAGPRGRGGGFFFPP